MSALWSTLTNRAGVAWTALREADWILLSQVLLFASAVPLMMRLKIPRLQRLLEPARLPDRAQSKSVDAIVRHFELARRVGAPLVRPGCLTRGLTLYYFLRKTGLDVSLTFGMGQIDGAFTGHCWLTRDEVPFLEPSDPRPVFAHIFSMPLDPSRRAPDEFRRARDLAHP